jgi:hypothetical protein
MRNPNGSTGKKLAILFALNEVGFKDFPEFDKIKTKFSVTTGVNPETGENVCQEIEDEFYQVVNSDIEISKDIQQKLATLFYVGEGCFSYISDKETYSGEDEILIAELKSLEGKDVAKLLQYFNYNW